jgi:hypothetical protein
MRFWIFTVAIVLTCSAVTAAHVTTSETAPEGHWRTLSEPHALAPCKGAIYYNFGLPNGSRAHLVVVDMRSGNWRIRPAASEPSTQPTSVQARQARASAATNGGYFNLHDGGHSTSYVVLDGKTVADPTCNPALVENPKLKPFLRRILNRSEVRFLRSAGGKTAIEITRHETPVPAGMQLVDSLQAGPQLLPTVEAVDEAFVRTSPQGEDVDAISARKEAARTAFGITNDGYALMVCISGKGQDPESSGITLEELAALMRRLGCVQALNLDGGASTTMFVRPAEGTIAAHFTGGGETKVEGSESSGTVVSGKSPETLVKSVLLLLPTAP